MNNYDRRWHHALTWAKKLKDLFDTQEYLLSYDEEYFTSNETKIEINEEKQTISFISYCSRFMIYDGDLSYDHGAYFTIREFKEGVIDKIHLFKEEPIIL